MALEDVLHNEVAVPGLVHWGRKLSVPILIQIKDREKMSVDDHVFEALAALKESAGAEAVARRLGDFFNHEMAVAALRQMGPAAEDALIEIAPSNDSKASLAAVELLGDVGTPNSYDLLRKAMKSSNREVKEAAKRSLKKIREREKAAM
ncbi:MAG: HEAT repeat domain-containing protein [Aeoliella sp.]